MKRTFFAMVALPFITSFLSLFIGAYSIPPKTILQMIFMKLMSPHTHSPWPAVYETIVFDIRLPRIALALLGGLALSVSGASLQTIFRNPLVDSYILGISAGAGFGAALAIAVFPHVLGIQLSAFVFGILAFILTYSIAKTRGGTPIVSLVLAGVIVSSLFSAALSLVKFFTDPHQLGGS